jgi:hypothetical protein
VFEVLLGRRWRWHAARFRQLGGIVKKTWRPFAAMAFAAMLFAIFCNAVFPGAATAGQVIDLMLK